MTVSKWRKRFARYGLDGLFDTKRSGTPHRYSPPEDRLRVITISCQKPEKITYWSIIDLTKEVNKTIPEEYEPYDRSTYTQTVRYKTPSV